MGATSSGAAQPGPPRRAGSAMPQSAQVQFATECATTVKYTDSSVTITSSAFELNTQCPHCPLRQTAAVLLDAAISCSCGSITLVCPSAPKMDQHMAACLTIYNAADRCRPTGCTAQSTPRRLQRWRSSSSSHVSRPPQNAHCTSCCWKLRRGKVCALVAEMMYHLGLQLHSSHRCFCSPSRGWLLHINYLVVFLTHLLSCNAEGDWTSNDGQRALQAQVHAVLDGYRAADLATARARQKQRQTALTGKGDDSGDAAGLMDMPHAAPQVQSLICCSLLWDTAAAAQTATRCHSLPTARNTHPRCVSLPTEMRLAGLLHVPETPCFRLFFCLKHSVLLFTQDPSSSRFIDLATIAPLMATVGRVYGRPDGSAVALLEVAAVRATPRSTGGYSGVAGWPLRCVPRLQDPAKCSSWQGHRWHCWLRRHNSMMHLI